MIDINYNKLCNDEPKKPPKQPKKPHPEPRYDNGTAYKKHDPKKNKKMNHNNKLV